MKSILLILAFFALSTSSFAEEITYMNGDEQLKGYVAYDKSEDRKLPAVLIVHEWWGHNEYVRQRADMLAKEGFFALAIDMYGDGRTASHPSKAGEFSSSVTSNAPLMTARFRAALEHLKTYDQVNTDKIAAIGYCFGGAVVLNMARSGEELTSVASYHGALDSIVEPKKGDVTSKIYVFHGGDDSLIPEKKVKAFKDQMDSVEADYKFITYPGVKHSFTNKGADKVAAEFNLPLKYDEEADKDSWAKTIEWFKKDLN